MSLLAVRSLCWLAAMIAVAGCATDGSTPAGSPSAGSGATLASVGPGGFERPGRRTVQPEQRSGRSLRDNRSVAPDGRSFPEGGAAPTERPLSPAERDPGRLMKLSRGDLSTMLGAPNFVRRDVSAEVWQYKTGSCILDLFLYKAPDDFKVAYYEFRSPLLGQVSNDECFTALLKRGYSAKAD